MNLPNALTVSRIFFVPLLLAVMLHGSVRMRLGGFTIYLDWLALGIFLSAAVTDLLDGSLARRRRQVTTIGKLLDPIADKLLISAAFISLVELDRVPAWMVVIIVGREFAVSGLRYMALAEGHTISASELGKAKMLMQVVAVSLLLLPVGGPAVGALAQVSLWVVVLFSVLSMGDYFHSYWAKVEEPAAPKVTQPAAKIMVPAERREVRSTVPGE